MPEWTFHRGGTVSNDAFLLATVCVLVVSNFTKVGVNAFTGVNILVLALLVRARTCTVIPAAPLIFANDQLSP